MNLNGFVLEHYKTLLYSRNITAHISNKVSLPKVSYGMYFFGTKDYLSYYCYQILAFVYKYLFVPIANLKTLVLRCIKFCIRNVSY